jgi:hypothetical protein
MPIQSPDLTRQPPRSPRVRLGGYVLLPRMLDKARATLAGKNGEYTYGCPLDQRFLEFAGLKADALKKQIAKGLGDAAILKWITSNAPNQPSSVEIHIWSTLQEQRVPGDTDSREFFNQLHAQAAPDRTDVATWFDLLDLDDYVSFGGRP